MDKIQERKPNWLVFVFRLLGGNSADETDGEELPAEDPCHAIPEDAAAVRHRDVRLPSDDELLWPGGSVSVPC